jgi:hypothetical protein
VAWVEPLELDTVVDAALSVAAVELLEVPDVSAVSGVPDVVSDEVELVDPVPADDVSVAALVQAARAIVLATDRATSPAVVLRIVRRPVSRVFTVAPLEVVCCSADSRRLTGPSCRAL